MGETLVVSLIICAVSVILWAVKVLYTIWWTPKKLERALRKQGIEGPSYKLFFGNMKENFGMVKEARSKPMNLSHNIAPRILPFALQTVEKYGSLSLIREDLGIQPLKRCHVIQTSFGVVRRSLKEQKTNYDCLVF
ncbi:hypothetical protein GIB67_001132 [Kingdonia uniflora]|uniref:Cytochrome P450 n=1 Tax=Kingdonia uniflora TaxID=39325 RepID=A0A7J7MH72_9MAGN|nr:hypothetical protein GIB67_001132 [Kingdonia uniflora]